MSRMTISDLPEKYQREAYRQLGGGKPLGMARAAAVGAFACEVVPAPAPRGKAPAKPIRQRASGDGLNRWEREFRSQLAVDFPHAAIHREISLPLANGCRYKVDFVVAQHTGETNRERRIVAASVRAYEVKGQRRAAGIAKLKVAASLYPWILFHLVTRPTKNGPWQIDIVHA